MSLIPDRLKTNDLPICFLYGTESFLIEEAVNLLKGGVIDNGFKDLNYHVFYIKDSEISSIISTCRTTPFISDKRVVVVKGIESIDAKESSELLEYIKKPCRTTLLILVAAAGKIEKDNAIFSELKKRNYAFEFNSISEKELPQWIKAEIRKKGKDISVPAVAHIVETIGKELSDLKREIEKLVLFVGDKKTIDLQDAEMTVSSIKISSVFNLADAIGKKDIKESLLILDKIMKTKEGGEPLKILGMIARQFRILLKIKTFIKAKVPQHKIAGMAGVSPFYFNNYLKQSSIFTEDELIHTFSRLYETDAAIKSSIPHRLALERLIVRLCFYRPVLA